MSKKKSKKSWAKTALIGGLAVLGGGGSGGSIQHTDPTADGVAPYANKGQSVANTTQFQIPPVWSNPGNGSHMPPVAVTAEPIPSEETDPNLPRDFTSNFTYETSQPPNTESVKKNPPGSKLSEEENGKQPAATVIQGSGSKSSTVQNGNRAESSRTAAARGPMTNAGSPSSASNKAPPAFPATYEHIYPANAHESHTSP